MTPTPTAPPPLPARTDAAGVHIAGQVEGASYPEGGHDRCFAVEEGSFWFRHRNDVISSVVRGHVPAGWFLDVGGGNGYVAQRLQNDGRPVVMIEPGERGAHNAAARGVRHVVQGTLGACDFPSACAAGIGMFDVLEHLADPGPMLGEVRRLLQPDGRLVLTVPSYGWLWSHEDADAGHHRRYTSGRLAHDLRAAAFRLEWASYVFAMLISAVGLVRALPYRLGRGDEAVGDAEEGRHELPSGPAGRALLAALRAEHRLIARGRRVPAGTSLVAVARPA